MSNESVLIEDDDDLQDNQGELGLHLTQSLLNSALHENEKLRTIIGKLERRQISLRDKVATEIYSRFLDLDFKADQAAEDAFKCADAFMRVRERGRVYEDDLLESLKELANISSSDQEFGAKIKLFLNKKLR